MEWFAVAKLCETVALASGCKDISWRDFMPTRESGREPEQSRDSIIAGFKTLQAIFDGVRQGGGAVVT